MSFFQSFISDANRGGQSLAEPAARAFEAENPDVGIPAAGGGAEDVFAASVHSEMPPPDIDTAPPVQRRDAVSKPEPVSLKEAAAHKLDDTFDAPETTMETQAPEIHNPDKPLVQKRPADPRLPEKTFNSAVQIPQPAVEAEPAQRAWHRQTVDPTEERLPAPPREATGQAVEYPVRRKLPNGAVNKNGVDAANRNKRPYASGLAVEWPPARRKKDDEKDKRTNRANGNGREAEFPVDMPFEAHENRLSANSAVDGVAGVTGVNGAEAAAREREAVPPVKETAVEAVRRDRQAFAPELLFSPFTGTAEKPSPVREESGPQVQIGTIEIIVESAQPAPQRFSSDTGFTRDPGRYYRRRL